MAKLIVVIGLPGAGKTTYLESLKATGEIDKFFDDYQGNAYDTSGNPYLSKNFGPLLVELKTNELPVAVSDIIFCVEKELHRFLQAVFSVLPEVSVEYRYFENKPELCIKNVQQRNRPERVEKEVKFINKYAPSYIVPTIRVLKIHS